jgi:hypothetical protein
MIIQLSELDAQNFKMHIPVLYPGRNFCSLSRQETGKIKLKKVSKEVLKTSHLLCDDAFCFFSKEWYFTGTEFPQRIKVKKQNLELQKKLDGMAIYRSTSQVALCTGMTLGECKVIAPTSYIRRPETSFPQQIANAHGWFFESDQKKWHLSDKKSAQWKKQIFFHILEQGPMVFPHLLKLIHIPAPILKEILRELINDKVIQQNSDGEYRLIKPDPEYLSPYQRGLLEKIEAAGNQGLGISDLRNDWQQAQALASNGYCFKIDENLIMGKAFLQLVTEVRNYGSIDEAREALNLSRRYIFALRQYIEMDS